MSDEILQHKLGKKPARPGAYSFKMTKYTGPVGAAALPVAPQVFGTASLVRVWDVLANDRYGDCVFAGAAHETMLWNREASVSVIFSDKAVLSDYSAVTGFDPFVPSTDRGTDMEMAAKYRRKTGVVDAIGQRHFIDAYLELPGVSAIGVNDSYTLLPAIASAAYVFGAVGIGIEFPSSAMEQFNYHQPWSVVQGSKIEGGHYVPLVGRKANGNFVVVTWGRLQEVTPDFLATYVDEAIVYISLERLKNGKSLQGFDMATLQADLALLGGQTPPSPVPSPVPVQDPNIQILDTWAAQRHTGSNASAAKAWQAYRASHQV